MADTLLRSLGDSGAGMIPFLPVEY